MSEMHVSMFVPSTCKVVLQYGFKVCKNYKILLFIIVLLLMCVVLMFGVFFESGVILSEVSCFSCFKNTSGGLSTPLGPCCVLLGESGVLLSPSNSYNATGSSFPSSWIFLYRGSRDSASATEMMLDVPSLYWILKSNSDNCSSTIF